MHLISTKVNGEIIPICVCELPTTVNRALERCSLIRLKGYDQKLINIERIYESDETFEGVDNVIYARYHNNKVEIVEKKTINVGIIFNSYLTTIKVCETISSIEVPRYDGLNEKTAVSEEDINAMKRKEFANEILTKIAEKRCRGSI